VSDLPPTPDEPGLAERGRRLIAEAVADTRAPLGLRERLEADRARAGRGRRRRRLLPAAATGLAVAAAVVLALVVAGGEEPSVADATALGDRPAEGPAPQAGPRPGTLRASVGGVDFPDWEERFDWPATGIREDELDGRTARTVFYSTRQGARSAYTIVDGAPLDPPENGAVQQVDGVPFTVVTGERETVVTWEEGGRTCVLSAPASVPTQRLVELAAWRAQPA
jgi:hypothetical protein